MYCVYMRHRFRSLAEKVTIMSVAGALTIGFVGLIVGLYIYAGNLFDIFVRDTFELRRAHNHSGHRRCGIYVDPCVRGTCKDHLF